MDIFYTFVVSLPPVIPLLLSLLTWFSAAVYVLFEFDDVIFLHVLTVTRKDDSKNSLGSASVSDGHHTRVAIFNACIRYVEHGIS